MRVVVVGGGVAGLSIAWELARGGAEVTLLRSPRPATSMVAAGMLAPMPESSVTRRLARPAAEALRDYPRFLAALAEDTRGDVGFVRSGVLRVADSEAEVESLREEAGTYEAAGLPSQWLSRRSALELAPGLPPSVAGGLYSFDEAQVQPEWLLAALEEAAFRREVDFVDDVVQRLDGTTAVTRDGHRLEADRLVIAAGSWSSELGGNRLPIRPVKGQLLAFEGAQGPAPILYRGHDYLLTKADGTVLLGGTMEEAGYSLDAGPKGEELRHILPGLWPALAGARATTRVGLRPAAPDGLPVVGDLDRNPGVYAFTGHFRNGFLLCPHQARLAAGEILRGEHADLLAAMRPRRFEGAALG